MGRYKFNKKLALKNRVVGFPLAEDVVNKETGEIIAQAGTIITEQLAEEIQNAAIRSIVVQAEERHVKVLSNLMVDLAYYVDVDKEELGVKEYVYYPVLKKILDENKNIEDIKTAIKRNINELIPKH
ncbi:MAG: hypothetical protein ACFWTJ_00470 [Lachnoclostridium sp.]